jgi:glycosyltransferase involved in cell wall biosynthesis
MTAVALIVPAHREPDHLDLCLASLYGQTFPEFEILVTEATGGHANDEVVEHHAAHIPQRLRHIAVPGRNVNLAQALNAAILSTTAEYLVFLGGDCLAQPEFVATHVDAADYGYFAHAETLPLDERITEAVDSLALGARLAFDEVWLKATSPEWHARYLRGSALNRVRDWLQKDTPGLRYWNGESSSCFRDDLMRVNGFDMDVEDWRLERDIANRLQNNGLEPVTAGPAANVLRLFNPLTDLKRKRGGRVPASLAPGGDVRAVTGLEELVARSERAGAA